MLLDNYKKQSPIVGVAGLGGGINSYIFLSSGGDYVISKSLRFNSADSSRLTRTFSAGNRKVFTISLWAKKSQIGSTYEDLFNCDVGGQFRFIWETNGNLEVYSKNGSTTTFHIDTVALFRDPSAWYHFVLSVDATNTSVKFYVNGVELTDFVVHTAVQNLDTMVNSAALHTIGSKGTGQYFNGYLADVNFVDGQALAATNFGEFDDDGVWQPKKFSGSYGTNGFHLDFKDTDAIGNDDAGSNNWTAENITTAVYGLATADQGMDVVTYTGNGNTRSISSLNFSPDLVWFKNRGTTNYHQLHDRVRGPLKRIYSNVNEGQNDYSTALTSFDSNGWTMGNGTPCNANGDNYVAWCWRAGGAASSNANGSTTTQVSVNQSYGFSISTWTSPSSADTDGWTLGHGLSSAPKFMLVKNISGAGNWTVYHASLGNTKALYLNETSTGQTNQSLWNNTDPTSTVWSAGSTGWYGTSNNFVTYAWSEVAGFSKFGSWTGNSSSDGPTVTLGFKPRFVLFKRSDTNGDSWTIFDTARDSGTLNIGLEPNDNSAEQTYNNRQIVVSDTGFQVTSTGSSSNAAGGTYIYAAFASKPNQSEVDSLLDSPSQVADQTDSGVGAEITGNYATLNPLTAPSAITLSNGNLNFSTAGSNAKVLSTIGMSSGKFYWEIVRTSGQNGNFGIATGQSANTTYLGGDAYGWGMATDGNKYHNGSGSSYGSSWGDNQIIGVAFDADAGSLYYYINGVVQDNGTPAFTGLTSGPYFASAGDHSCIGNINFGQRTFAHAAPSGYKSLNTANLATPTVKDGSKYFDTKLFTGNNSTQSITMDNSELSPDFVWLKRRTPASHHGLYDSVRGATKQLSSNLTNAESTQSQGLTSFDSNGFTLGNLAGENGTSEPIVSWNWDAGNGNKTYAITVANPGSGNKYYADGVLGTTLTLAEGSTYKFDQSDSTNSSHPLRFSTTNNGTHGGGTEYTTGVTTVGTPGSAGAYTQIVIASGAPTLYVYCTNHSGMGFQVNTSDTGGYTIPVGGLNSSSYDQSQTWSSSLTASSGLSGATNAFDGSVSTRAQSSAGTNQTLTFAPSSGVSFTSILEIYCDQGDATPTASWNGNSVNPGGGAWVTVATGSGTINASYPLVINTQGASQYATLKGVRLDGKLLVDSGVSVTNVPSIESRVMASPESGFSIVKYNISSAGSTINTFGTGLNAAPDLVILKPIDDAQGWTVYHKDIPDPTENYIFLETTAAYTNSNVATFTSSSSTFGCRETRLIASGDSANILALCFNSVEGYSSVGSYIGNGDADGRFIYTGFAPSWILFKRSDSSSDWSIYDTARDPHNVAGDKLEPNTTDAESEQGTVIDILSNGFKFRRNSLENGGNDVYLYMAFASHPFQSSRAR